MKFRWYNARILWNFVVLCWLPVSLSVLSKDDCKISVSFEHIQNFKVLDFLMAKVKKVNIAVTYYWYGKSCLMGIIRTEHFWKFVNLGLAEFPADWQTSGAMTLNIMTLSITTFSTATLSIMRFSIIMN